MEITIYSDGASRSNPGPASGGYVIFGPGEKILYEGSVLFGIKTNNEAEYLALHSAIEYAIEHYAPSFIRVFIDSQLIERQILGQYRVKDAKLRIVYKKIMEILKNIPFSIERIPRNENAHADRLANEALDAQK